MMMEAREKAPLEDNSYMFKKLASGNPLACDGSPNPKAFENWIRGIEKPQGVEGGIYWDLKEEPNFDGPR